MDSHQDPDALKIQMCIAKSSNPRGYLTAKCNDGKNKLVIEVTQKQTKHYKGIVEKIKAECEKRWPQPVKLYELKAWAKKRRAELMK